MGNSARLHGDSLVRLDNGRLLMSREPESFERVLDWTEGEMNELEPAKSTQWLWFGADCSS